MTKEELKTLIKQSLYKIENEMQTKTGRYVSVGNGSITDILVNAYGNDIAQVYEIFYKEFING